MSFNAVANWGLCDYLRFMKRTAFVAAFGFGVLHYILVSTKLLLTGQLLAAGNVMRHAVIGWPYRRRVSNLKR